MHPDELYYTKQHEWLKLEGNEALIGITDYAQRELGDLVYVELPGVGTELSMDQEMATIESVKAVAEVYAPVSCEILASNEDLLKHPEKLNSDPYNEGWIAKIRLHDLNEVEALLSAEEYTVFVEGERE